MSLIDDTLITALISQVKCVLLTTNASKQWYVRLAHCRHWNKHVKRTRSRLT